MDLRSCSNQGSGSSRSQLPPCPKGSPSGGQPVLNPADGPLPPLTCQLGSTLLPCLPLASFCLPHHPQSQGAQEAASMGWQGSVSSNWQIPWQKCFFSSITETGLDLEVVAPWGPKATFERKQPFTCVCMTLPRYL